MSVQRNNGNMERRDDIGPDDTIIIMVLFDGRGHNATDADAVTPHGHQHRFAVFVEHSSIHGFAVCGAQLENMANLNTAADSQCSLALRATITFTHLA